MSFTFSEIINNLKIKVNGIVHLGANECQELNEYLTFTSIDKILWVEALQKIVDRVKLNNSLVNIYQAVLTDKDNEPVKFNITNNNSLSSSIYDFNLVAIQHPELKIVDSIPLISSRFDSIIQKYNISLGDSNIMILDLQGAELPALKGVGEYMRDIEVIFIEINTDDTYKNCSKFEEINNFLTSKGFSMYRKHIWSGYTYGDAVYIKLKNITP